MKITINFQPKASAGYTPRKSLTLFNVSSVADAGVNMVRVRMTFSDDYPTYDHVASVSLIPEKAE